MSKITPLTQHQKDILGDIDTPVTAFLKLQKTNSFLLESIEGGQSIGRYSFIGFDPLASVICQNKRTQITVGSTVTQSEENPITLLQTLLESFQITPLPNTPQAGGAFGFFGWDTIRHIEKIRPARKPGDDYPLMHFIIPQKMIIFDHVLRKITLSIWLPKDTTASAEDMFAEIESIFRRPLSAHPVTPDFKKSDPMEGVTSNLSKTAFIDKVKKAKDHIKEGDIFQIVLSQKFAIPAKETPFDVYRKLRYVNPSPYMYFFNFQDYQIIGSSPEILVKLKNGKAALRPVAGTRPRIAEREEELITELKADEKEVAEHIMLVDLGRNDLGRVCKFHTVQTKDIMTIEKYSHVIHMVSHVEGELEATKTAFDLFKATFPAGTLSGTPKIRAIELIEELEPENRGLYGGALGYIDFQGNMDLCIIIRTILAKNNRYTIQAGAGIVADSDPEREYEECINKAKGMLLACH